MSVIIPVSQRDFDTVVLKSELPVVVDFWAPWCSPCKQLLPILDDTAETYQGEVLFVKVNADENPEIVSQFHVRGLPPNPLFGERSAPLRLPRQIAPSRKVLKPSSVA